MNIHRPIAVLLGMSMAVGACTSAGGDEPSPAPSEPATVSV